MTQTQSDFGVPASEARFQRVAARKRERNIEVLIANNGEEACQIVLEKLPRGEEVHSGKSMTLQDTGIYDSIRDPNQYSVLLHQCLRVDRKTQGRGIRKVIAAPDYELGSVHAITEQDILVIAFATGS